MEEFRPRLLESVVWIFYDFVSLHQYRRTEDQEQFFRRALRDIFVMYSHDAVEVHRIEKLTPESVRESSVAARGPKIFVYWKEEQKVTDVLISKLKLNGTPYEERGWCRSEKEWSSLRTWMKGENPVPLPPDMFRARMQQMKFTHREDREKVFKLQAKVFHQKAASTTKLLIENLDGDKIEVLAAALPFYTNLKELVVKGSPENAWKAALAVVESGVCEVEIACENVRDEDAVTLAADLCTDKCGHLKLLHLKCQRIGELGRNALQQMMEHRMADLVISSTADRNSGYFGQEIEPAMVPESCTTLRVLVSMRRRPAESTAAGPVRGDSFVDTVMATAQVHMNRGATEQGVLIQQPTEARPDSANQTVTVHCLAGSSFELEVNSGETGLDVAKRIETRVDHNAEGLVLTSGGCVIDRSRLLLHQVQHEEITYLVQQTGYGLSEPEEVLRFLADADIRLVRLEYLIELHASGRPLPRRQEAERETTSSGLPALVESRELQEVEVDPKTAHMSLMIRHPAPRRVKVHLVSISHMWESMEHPDPWRFGAWAMWIWHRFVVE